MQEISVSMRFGTALAVMFAHVGHEETLWGWSKQENDEA